MNHPTSLSRRELLKSAAMATAALPLLHFKTINAAQNGAADPFRGLKIGVATYTFREWPIEQAIKGVQRVGLKYVSIKNVKNHVDLSHTSEERKQRAQMFRAAGLIPLSVGNVSMRGSDDEIRKAFEYAKDVGVNVIVCAPRRDAIPLLDKLVKEFDIKLAIHNHGPEDKNYFPSPYDAMNLIEKYDKRIGLCIDVGHTARAGVDPAESIIKCKDRLYDMHLKDITAMSNKNDTVTEVGRGILNTKSILAALLKIKYQGLVGFEYEKDGKDPLAGLAESVGYIKGVLTGLK